MSDYTPPPLLPAELEGIPDELKNLHQWVTWQAEWNPKRERWDKIPTNPRTGRNASTTNPRTWGTFAEACTAWQSGKADGIGFVFTQDDPYCGIDLDSKANACREPETGELAPWAAAIVERLDSYTEPSVSGTGIHIIVRGTLPDGTGSRIASHEAYQDGRFFAFTGRPLPGYATIHERTAALATWHAETAIAKPTPRERTEPAHTITAEDSVILDRVRRTEKGRRLLAGDWKTDHGDKSASEGDLSLANFLAWAGCDRAQGERLLAAHSMVDESKRQRPDYIRRTMEKALADTTPGEFVHLTANGRHTPSSTDPAGERAAIDPASCPVQLAAALARITALEAQLAEVSTENERLRSENHMLRVVSTNQARIRKNNGLGSTRHVLQATVNLFANRESAEPPPEDGMYQVPVMAIAEGAGCKEDAARRQLEKANQAGLLRRELRLVPVPRVDTESGEIITTMEKRQFLGMPEGCENVIDFTERLAQARIDGKQWGGQRTPCPVCKEIAGQLVTRTVRCLGCGHETTSSATILPAVTEATPQDAAAVTEESTDGASAVLSATPPRILRGGETPESPRVDSVTQRTHLAGWGVPNDGDPPPGSVAAAWIRGRSLHFDTDVRPAS